MIIGKYTYGESNINIRGKDSGHNVKIGAFCSLAGNITIYVGANHRKDWITAFPFGHIHKGVFTKFNGDGHPSSKGDVIIGNDVWIADNVTIMSGITIGNGAIIANNSHVVKDVEPYSIVGGNPARFISYRFTPEQIEKLQAMKWWDWDDAKINDNTPLLCSPNIDDFINKYYT
jgi:acetyltransferase-like isoleucine patch superfamily enzyme